MNVNLVRPCDVGLELILLALWFHRVILENGFLNILYTM